VKFSRNFTENPVNEINLLTIGVVCLWLRVINFSRYNEYLGRFMGVVKRLVSEIILFFVLYLINLLLFATIAESSFRDLSEYNNVWVAFRTLFYASFGTFDFDKIEQTHLGKYYGQSFLIVFLVINIGLFMSLFISIITVLFQVFRKHDRIYQMVETLKLRSTTQADKNYSLLISVPAPFNFFLFFAAPILLTSKNPQQMNQKLLLIFYIPVLAVVTCFFVAGEMIMIPFVYVKMVFHKLTMVWVYSKSYRVSRADKFINFIFFFFFGPFIVIGNSCVDTWFFMRHLVLIELRKIKHKTRFHQIDKQEITGIEDLFKAKQEKILNFKEVASQVREDMGIMALINRSLFP